MVSLNCLTLAKPAANAISVNGSVVVSISTRAVCARWERASASGGAPTVSTSVRWRCRSLTASEPASPDTPDRSTTPSAISRIARPARSARVSHSGEPGTASGLHRLHARSPAS